MIPARGPSLRSAAPAGLPPEQLGPESRSLWAELLLLWRHRTLLVEFAVNDLKHRYVGSSIGIFWMVVNPIIELVTYTFVFHVLMKVSFHPAGGLVHYSLFNFCGMVAWFATAEGLTRATTSITEHAHLLRKANFPAAILPAHMVLSALFNQVVRTIILALGVIFLGNGLSWHFLLVPPFMLIQAVFVLGLAFFFSTAQVFFRDTAHWIGAALLAWMFVTPIFYPPDAYPPQFQVLLQLNPLAHVVGVYQELVLNQRLPNVRQMMLLPIAASLSFGLGYSVFAHHRRRFADVA